MIKILKCISFMFALLFSTNVQAEEPYGDSLIMAEIGEPSNFIIFLSTDSASQNIGTHFYVSLLKYDENIEIIPYAAESYEILEEGKLLKFKLREDIYWEDGTQLTADDVTFTYNTIIDPNTPTAYATDYLLVKDYKQTGKFTIEVRYDAVYARSIISWMQPILPKHILENEDITKTSFSRKPLSAGPFTLESWEAGSRIVLKANENYFLGRPKLDKLVYRFIPDPSTIFLEAKNNALDMILPTAQQFLLQTKTPEWDRNWNKFKYLSFGYTFFGFNLKNPLFQQKEVRQALSYGIDKQAIIDSVLLGLGEPTVGPYKPGTWVYNNALTPYPYDVDKAKSLLKEAGFTDTNNNRIIDKNGQEFSFTVITNQGNDPRIKSATIMQAYLKDLGIEMKIRVIEWAAFINDFVNKGNFDAVLLSWNILQDPDLFDVWHSSKTLENGLNLIDYKNKEVDRLLEEARSTLDQAQRKLLYDEFQAILHEEQPYLFLYVPYATPMVQKRFENVKVAPVGLGYNIEEWYVPTHLQKYK